MRRANRGAGAGCVVDFLRDPVERTISEFMFARAGNLADDPRSLMVQDQWDIHDHDMRNLTAIVRDKSLPEAWKRWIEYPHNPARNRQTMYLLGFERISC